MKSINEISFNGKKVFIRVDFNVPFNDYGEITDSSRIAASLPTIEYVLSNGGACILASHLGRPVGKDSWFLRPFELDMLTTVFNLS